MSNEIELSNDVLRQQCAYNLGFTGFSLTDSQRENFILTNGITSYRSYSSFLAEYDSLSKLDLLPVELRKYFLQGVLNSSRTLVYDFNDNDYHLVIYGVLDFLEVLKSWLPCESTIQEDTLVVTSLEAVCILYYKVLGPIGKYLNYNWRKFVKLIQELESKCNIKNKIVTKTWIQMVDIEIPNVHCFYANGILVHNTRIVANLTHDATLVNSFKQGLDTHAECGKMLFTVPKVEPKQRKIAKEINLGIPYGACLSPDVLINTNEGKKRVESLRDSIFKVKVLGKEHWSFVKLSGNKPVYEYYFKSGDSIKCTPDHRFPTFHGFGFSEDQIQHCTDHLFLVKRNSIPILNFIRNILCLLKHHLQINNSRILRNY